MSLTELSIDCGSNFTTIYKKNCGVVLREPTLALIQTSGKNMRVLKMGLDAQRLYGKSSDDEVFVKPVVEGVVKNVSLTQKILFHFFSKVINYKLVKPAIKLIVCLPVGLTDAEFEDYKKVFFGLGFMRVDFVSGVVCSTLVDAPYFSLGKASMIVNIGGGKTEIACIVGGKILNGCSLNVGGNLVDKGIVEHLQKTKGYVVSQNVACKLKEEIGSLYETDKSNMEVLVQDSVVNSQISTIITAKDIMKPIYETYFKILQTVQAFFAECGSEVAQDIKNEGIVLCGGGSKITGLEKFFKKILNLSVFVLDNEEVSNVIGTEKLFFDPNLLQKIVEEN
jgi:rod shape-determining protein MreB